VHAKNFCSEFLDIFKNYFRPAGAYAPMSQNEFPETYLNLSKVSSECRHFFYVMLELSLAWYVLYFHAFKMYKKELLFNKIVGTICQLSGIVINIKL
jgi:hypothetical protein